VVTTPYTPVYDLASGANAAIHYTDIGMQAMPDDKVIDMLWLMGGITGAPVGAGTKLLYGLVIEMTNQTSGTQSIEQTRCRGIAGNISLDGPGSGEFINARTTAQVGSTGYMNTGSFRFVPVSTTNPQSSGVLILHTGADGIGTALRIESTPGQWQYGIDFLGGAAVCTNSALRLPATGDNGQSQIRWGTGSLRLAGHDNTTLALRAASSTMTFAIDRSAAEVAGITSLALRAYRTGPAAVANLDELGRIEMQGWVSSGFFSNAAVILASVDGTPSSTAVPGRLDFYTYQASSAARMSIRDRLQMLSPIQLWNAAADPATAGYLQRNNNRLGYHYGQASATVPLDLWTLPNLAANAATTALQVMAAYTIKAGTLINGSHLDIKAVFLTTSSPSVTFQVWVAGNPVNSVTVSAGFDSAYFDVMIRHRGGATGDFHARITKGGASAVTISHNDNPGGVFDASVDQLVQFTCTVPSGTGGFAFLTYATITLRG
jgi:hypothetical protein